MELRHGDWYMNVPLQEARQRTSEVSKAAARGTKQIGGFVIPDKKSAAADIGDQLQVAAVTRPYGLLPGACEPRRPEHFPSGIFLAGMNL